MSIFGQAQALQEEFNGASDRAVAVVAGAFLDQLLFDMLLTFLVEDTSKNKEDDNNLFRGSGPLAAFSIRIRMAFRLGLISEDEHRWLHIVRNVRNFFAHTHGVASFQLSPVRELCANFKISHQMVGPRSIYLGVDGGDPPIPDISRANADDPRAIFQEAVFVLLDCLSARVTTAMRERRNARRNFGSIVETWEEKIQDLKALIGVADEFITERQKLRVDLEMLASLGHDVEDIKVENEAGREAVEKSINEMQGQIKLCESIKDQVRKAQGTEE